MKQLILSAKFKDFAFSEAQLEFEEGKFESIFQFKNNKTLAQTLTHNRYKELSGRTNLKYADFLDWKLGEFLIYLKRNGDPFYKEFLNPYGDLLYCRFSTPNSKTLSLRGIYLFEESNSIVYIGKTKDSFKTRINNGYGKIHPKNCYIDGQRTNCLINSKIAGKIEGIRLFLCPVNGKKDIDLAESSLLEKYRPIWNIQK